MLGSCSRRDRTGPKSPHTPGSLSAECGVPGLAGACSWMRGVRLGKTVLRGFDGKITGFTS